MYTLKSLITFTQVLFPCHQKNILLRRDGFGTSIGVGISMATDTTAIFPIVWIGLMLR